MTCEVGSEDHQGHGLLPEATAGQGRKMLAGLGNPPWGPVLESRLVSGSGAPGEGG